MTNFLCAAEDDYGLADFLPPPPPHRFTCDLCQTVKEYPTAILDFDQAAFLVSLYQWRHFYDEQTGALTHSRCRACAVRTGVHLDKFVPQQGT